MALAAHATQRTATGQMTVRVLGDSKSEVTSKEARELALTTASKELGKCGFQRFGDWTLVRPDGTELTEKELLEPLPPMLRHLQDIHVMATL